MQYKDAIAGGLETPELLTNLGYSYWKSGQYDEAVEVLEKVRLMGGDTTTANLILAYAYSMIWQRRGARGKRIHKFDDQLLVSLIEDCSDVPAKYKTASELYVTFTRIVAGNAPVAKAEWAQSAFDEFRRGVDVGLDVAYWNNLKIFMPESILETEEAKQFTEQADGRRSTQHRTLYLLDPLHGTKLERWTERKLTNNRRPKSSSLIANATE